MLLALLISHLTVLTVGIPFHKYPFVFLLDVGNEELEKTNTEQIRVSIPGGSVALRYPAIADGEAIAHVRVSGIDFGTDLKANIVDGGPGYKYVVLVFMGNPGISYDAVVTIETVPNDITLIYNAQNNKSVLNYGNSYKISEENNSNDSAEDMSDNTGGAVNTRKAYVEKSNSELMQSSSNVYNYAQSDVIDSDDYIDDTGNDLQYQKDIHTQYSEKIDQVDERNVETEDYIASNDEDDQNKIADDSKADMFGEYNDHTSYDDKEPMRAVDNNSDEKYQAINQHLYEGAGIYPQEDEQDLNVNSVYQDSADEDDPMEFEQIFNDEEVHNDAEKYQDSNNNYIDSHDSSAVAY